MAWVDKTRSKWRVRVRIDGEPVTDSVHQTPEAAELRRKQLEVEQVVAKYTDPRKGRIALADYVPMWAEESNAGPAKAATYNSHLRNHILPYFGSTKLVKIDNPGVKRFVKHLRDPQGGDLAGSSTRDVITLLGLIMRSAIDAGRITVNPCEGIIVPGSRSATRPFITPLQVLRLASRCRLMSEKILIVTAGYTGMRWGELTGLGRDNVFGAQRRLHVHPEVGSLHEVGKDLWLGSPKTEDSVRFVDLPPFLCELIDYQMNSHARSQVFVGAQGKWLRRSGFSRRVMRHCRRRPG